MVIYFSGTGNSRYAAKMIASRLGDEVSDAGVYIKENRKAAFVSHRPWVFVSPTYAWQLPRIFADFIRKSSFSGNQAAYFVMTCGSEIGNASKSIRELCGFKDLTCMGVLPVIMPENYIAMFDAPEKAEAGEIVQNSQKALQQAIDLISQKLPFPAAKPGLLDKFYSAAASPLFYKLFVKASAFYATDACTVCGKCQKLCPLNNIIISNEKPAWGKECTHCMACICGCPTKAIEYGKHSIGKPRYQCPEYVE